MNGNLTKIAIVGTGIVVSVTSGWIAHIIGYGERIARVETAVESIQTNVGNIDRKLDMLINQLL